MAVHGVHPQSQVGYAPGKSELYDKARPTYPPETLEHIRRAVGGKDELNIVEIACGSGIFTRAMLADAQFSSSIREMKCVDPNDGMLGVFQETVKDPRITALEGRFDSTGVPDSFADLVVIATAFHWCLDVEGAVKEFIRILKPDGILCFLWNAEHKEKAGWLQQLWDLAVSVPVPGGSHDFVAWRRFYDLQEYKDNFEEHEDTTIEYDSLGTREIVLERIMTWSAVAALPNEGKQKLKEEMNAIIDRGDGLVWIDENEGTFKVPYKVPIVVMRRKPS